LAENEQKNLEKMVYWSRCAIGAVLGLTYAVFWRASIGSLLTAASVMITVYLGSHYLISALLGKHRLEVLGGKGKLQTLGIGIFFLSFLFFWVLFYSLFFYTG